MSICRKNNWDQTLERLVNNQINLELKAFHYYNALYSYFMNDGVGFPGLANYFKKSADEELEHARKFIDYQNTRGGIVNIDVIERPNFSFDNSETWKYGFDPSTFFEAPSNNKLSSNLDPSLESVFDSENFLFDYFCNS